MFFQTNGTEYLVPRSTILGIESDGRPQLILFAELYLIRELGLNSMKYEDTRKL